LLSALYIYYLTHMLSKNRVSLIRFLLSLLTILGYLIFFFCWWCNFESEKKNHTVYERSRIVNSFSWNVSSMCQPHRTFSVFFSHTNAHSFFFRLSTFRSLKFFAFFLFSLIICCWTDSTLGSFFSGAIVVAKNRTRTTMETTNAHSRRG
jgi:hypothetical protein